ncbi:hypothetical protein J2S13_002811 [Oikeobacillus pervagus]|uniref:Pullulanase n=1 Tax=Oikeobacillus pervagus TaxID=1325931 RepID=A0AAJ1T0L1_9BACI|nr:DUF6509 family protein [Oikeobacillus pervagus]MDQ0216353.1 hypothetical protein [Oikeobacillus pervagus]
MKIMNHSIELLHDPFGILSGDRYEFIIDVEVAEDDELYSEYGVYIKVLYVVEEEKEGILQYHMYERTTDQYQDFLLEQEEENMLEQFCKEQISNF